MGIVRKYTLFNDSFSIKIPDDYVRLKDSGMNSAECFRDKKDNTIIIMECEASNVNVSEQNMMMYNDIKRRCCDVSEPECTYRIVDGVRQSKVYFNEGFDKHYVLVSYQAIGHFYAVIMCNVDGQFEKWKKDMDYVLDSISNRVEEE